MQIQFTELRQLEEQRLVPALEAWNQAKTNLENAIAQAEAREKDYHAMSKEVQRRLAALSVVFEMSKDLLPESAARPQSSHATVKPLSAGANNSTSQLTATEEPNALADRKPNESVEKPKGFLGASSRQLFPATWRTRAPQAAR
jgi:hypothetical protein